MSVSEVMLDCPLSGFLLKGSEWPKDNLLFSDGSSLELTSRSEIPWDVFEYISVQSIFQDDEEGFDGKYHYQVMVRRSDDRLIALARNRAIINRLVFRNMVRTGGFKVSKVPIDTARIVDDFLSQSIGEYVLSRVYARVIENGATLESISFFGANLARSTIFRDVCTKENVLPHACGLKPSAIDEELLIVNSYGGLTFQQRGIEGLHAGLLAMSYLWRNGYTA